MKKTIGTVRAMVFGSMLAATFSCEGMNVEHVASLIKTSDEDAIVNVWMDCLSRSYSPTAQASLPGFT
ncbi:MAG: hypothetical protein LBC04_00140, partial [Holosporaceae bacterium]|nr:hypothetical protein [Holosporaceae bacterium]